MFLRCGTEIIDMCNAQNWLHANSMMLSRYFDHSFQGSQRVGTPRPESVVFIDELQVFVVQLQLSFFRLTFYLHINFVIRVDITDDITLSMLLI
mmetsp:Transcript_68748/g.114265  ORF Transcript_68748/g.114265 Transcript_68748/m.114265 type:complete len:94 (-) Transcript_68748:420-701(-)